MTKCLLLCALLTANSISPESDTTTEDSKVSAARRKQIAGGATLLLVACTAVWVLRNHKSTPAPTTAANTESTPAANTESTPAAANRESTPDTTVLTTAVSSESVPFDAVAFNAIKAKSQFLLAYQVPLRNTWSAISSDNLKDISFFIEKKHLSKCKDFFMTFHTEELYNTIQGKCVDLWCTWKSNDISNEIFISRLIYAYMFHEAIVSTATLKPSIKLTKQGQRLIDHFFSNPA